ncbi:hypothetical protein G7054_g4741 [Neopestalotiopsis clavispora]|nr:hypothetical protein G7054_g4741 [Neopestalotiopsis clavispora]
MTARTKNPLSGMHTAGIFSDMSIDGPIIGTLVLIVDRAKNLPNRKTIGKQDPYCAARLGKEARKTTTDVRGGQTPKWDQELRFPVHDSPDYYQLKLSVFNDDKKTELIGETWIDLRDIILPGGGQSDQWQSLNCKGKYAGEIRIETTFYDSRPKPEKPVAKPKPVSSAPEADAGSVSSRTAVKRRPLPSNPGSTEPSPAAKPMPEPVQAPARPQPHGNFIPTQSPLQAVEYNMAQPARFAPVDPYGIPDHGNRFATPPSHHDDAQFRRSVDTNDKFIALEDDRRHSHEQYSRAHDHGPRTSHHHIPPVLEASPPAVLGPRSLGGAPPADDGRPPPPPAHRVRNNSATSHEVNVPSQHKATPSMQMRHDVLRNEAHRHTAQVVPSPTQVMPSGSSYPGRPVYRPYDSAPEMPKQQLLYEDPNHPSPPRHHSYDAVHEPHPRSLQPTVEDVPETWTPPAARSRRPSSIQEAHAEMAYGAVPSPAPLNLSGRGSAASANFPPSPYGMNNFTTSPSPIAAMNHYDDRAMVSHSNSFDASGDPYTDRSMSDGVMVPRSSNFDVAPVPPALVPGVDPALSLEIAARIREDQSRSHERRYTQPAPVVTPTRGRQHSEPPASHVPQSYSHHHRDSGGYGASYSHGASPVANTQMRRHSPSPNPSHTIKRKSVSPAPPPREDGSGRRLSGVPFGPDSYDELNPSVSSGQEETRNGEYTNAYGKIVTADGREVDPSDHLPMDTWAPEPEPKQPKNPEAAPGSRPALAGAQPLPPSGRRQIRITARPQSMAAIPSPYAPVDIEPSPPAASGRNKLQKKRNHHVSALPAPAPHPNPLGPATSHQRNSTPPTALVRAGTFDYENYGPAYGSPNGAYISGPPIPAKVPLMSGGLGPGGNAGGEDWALMDEMSRIDIGTGRSRRHGGY